MDDKLRSDFKALGYSIEDLDKLSWESEDFPAITKADLTKLVATPKRNWSWAYWLAGFAAVFGIFELTVARKLETGPKSGKKVGWISIFRKKAGKNPEKNELFIRLWGDIGILHCRRTSQLLLHAL